MAITSENLPKHELIGLKCEVINCTDESKIGIEGEVLDETKSMIQIEDRKIEKKDCVFRFTLPEGFETEIDGEIIDKRPVEGLDTNLS